MADQKMGLAEDCEDLSKAMVTNLARTVTSESLQQFLIDKCSSQIQLSAADFKEIKIMDKSKENKQNFAFVTFTTCAAIDYAISALYSMPDSERKLEDNTLQIRRAVPRDMKNNAQQVKNWDSRTKKIFIASLPKSIKKAELLEELETIIGGAVGADCPLGKIAKYEIVPDKDDAEKHKGIGFIHLESRDGVPEADKAKDRLPEHLADKLAIKFGNPFTIGGRAIDLKKNDETGAAGRGGARGGMGLGRGAAGRGGRGRGMPAGGYAAGSYGQYPGSYDPYAAYGGYAMQGYPGYGGYPAQAYGYGFQG